MGRQAATLSARSDKTVTEKERLQIILHHSQNLHFRLVNTVREHRLYRAILADYGSDPNNNRSLEIFRLKDITAALRDLPDRQARLVHKRVLRSLVSFYDTVNTHDC
jgi:hypothetical protein